jgi:hypothetical protein
MGHMRSHLERGIDQDELMKDTLSLLNKERKDIWWVNPDGDNADEVAKDVANSLYEQGLPWFRKMTDLERVFLMVEEMRDCFCKYTKAAHLARRLGYDDKWRHYDALAEKEAVRIGFSTDRSGWSGI